MRICSAREAFKERLELIATQVQLPIADQRNIPRRTVDILQPYRFQDPNFPLCSKWRPWSTYCRSAPALTSMMRATKISVASRSLPALNSCRIFYCTNGFSPTWASAEAWQPTCRMQAHNSSLFCREIPPIVMKTSVVEAAIKLRRFASFITSYGTDNCTSD